LEIISSALAIIKALPIIRDFVNATGSWYKAVRRKRDDIGFDEAVERRDPKKVSEELGDVL
jgi:hypothetical protein